MKQNQNYTRKRYHNANMMNIHIENNKLMEKIMEVINIRRISTGRKVSSWCVPLFEHLDENVWRVHMYLGIKENSKGENVYCDRYCYIADDEIVKKFLQCESIGKAYNVYLKQNDKVNVEPEMEKHLNPDEGLSRIDLAREARELKMVEELNQL